MALPAWDDTKLKLPRTTPPLPRVFISYARDDQKDGGASREQIVNRMEASLRKSGYDIRRDQTNLGYGESLRLFMEEFGHGGCIIAVVSDKYLRSPFCMYNASSTP